MTTRATIAALTISGAALTTVIAAGVVLADDRKNPDPKTEPSPVGKTEEIPTEVDRTSGERGETITTLDPREVISGWPKQSRAAAEAMIVAHGAPREVTATSLTWRAAGPWKRTVVHRDEVDHQFPRVHVDVLEQVIDYKVPIDRVDDLLAFDGSLVVDRTRGELSIRCDREAMNLAAINLAHQVATGKLEPDAARQQLAEAALELSKKKGTPPAITKKLQFDVPSGQTADPDRVHKLKVRATAAK